MEGSSFCLFADWSWFGQKQAASRCRCTSLEAASGSASAGGSASWGASSSGALPVCAATPTGPSSSVNISDKSTTDACRVARQSGFMGSSFGNVAALMSHLLVGIPPSVLNACRMKSRMYWADHSEPGKVAGSQKESQSSATFWSTPPSTKVISQAAHASAMCLTLCPNSPWRSAHCRQTAVWKSRQTWVGLASLQLAHFASSLSRLTRFGSVSWGLAANFEEALVDAAICREDIVIPGALGMQGRHRRREAGRAVFAL
mmetsp:Transcript_84724/g.182655  ORF Transcript_84724/g.182655 Transcript_84724/m.182655 type:complete len:259 (-) Transcript_84724:11-787(-)